MTSLRRFERARRFLQFRLIHLLALITLLCIFPPFVHWRREEAVLSRLPSHQVAYDYDDDESSWIKIVPSWLRKVALPWRGYVVSLHFSDNASVQPEQVRSLERLRRLRKLRFPRRKHGDPDVTEHLVTMPRLEELTVERVAMFDQIIEVSDDGLGRIAACCPGLRTLKVESRSITDRGVAHLAQLRYLESVDLPRSSVTAVSTATWKSLPLKTLNLDQTLWHDAELATLRRELAIVTVTGRMKAYLRDDLHRRTSLKLLTNDSFQSFSRHEFEVIARSPLLADLREAESLRIGESRGVPDPEGQWQADWLDQFPRVRNLRIIGTRFPARNFENLTALEYLELSGGFLEPEAIRTIAKLPRLKKLFVWQQPGPEFFELLAEATALEEIHIHTSDFLRTSAEALFQSLENIPRLRVLCLYSNHHFTLNGQAITALSRLKQLQMLCMNDLWFGNPNSHAAVPVEMEALQNLTNLNVLVMRDAHIDDARMRYLCRIPNLRFVVLRSLHDSDVRPILNLKRLEGLWIDARLTYAQMVPFVSMPTLRKLNLECDLNNKRLQDLTKINRDLGFNCEIYSSWPMYHYHEPQDEAKWLWWCRLQTEMGNRFVDNLEETFGSFLDKVPVASGF